MTTRDTGTVGAPCWVDLMTSDVEGSRRFYGEVFGWTADDPNPDFGGYFNFAKDGALIAGGMAAQPDMGPANVWSVYLTTDDATKTAAATTAEGGQVLAEPMPVADLGTMVVLTDPTGAAIGAWQPGTFGGFGAQGQPGTPAWFELHTREYDAAVSFYRNVFHWDTEATGDSPDFRYTVQKVGDDQRAGIMDATAHLPEGVPNHWAVYFAVEDADATIAKIVDLGGSVVAPAEDTPYGRLAVVADPNGAQLRLLGPNVDAPANG